MPQLEKGWMTVTLLTWKPAFAEPEKVCEGAWGHAAPNKTSKLLSQLKTAKPAKQAADVVIWTELHSWLRASSWNCMQRVSGPAKRLS